MGFVPALIKQLSDQESAEVALIENLQREELSPVETALAFRALMHDFGLTQQQIAAKVGKSPSVVCRFLHLLEVPEKMLESLERDELQEGHIRALMRVEDSAQREQLYSQVLAEKLSVRETEKRSKCAPGEEDKPVSPSLRMETALPAEMTTKAVEQTPPDLSENELLERLMQYLEVRVAVNRTTSTGGYIEIGFRGEDTLLRTLNRILHA